MVGERLLALAERLATRSFKLDRELPLDHDGRSTAFHEAAHAVLFDLIDFPVAHATIDGGLLPAGLRGCVTFGDAPIDHEAPARAPPELSRPIEPEKKVAMFVSASVLFAGREAEHLLAGHPFGYRHGGESSDDRAARYILSTAFEMNRGSAPAAGCQFFARTILIERWHEVKAAAERLLTEGTIDGDQIRHAIANARANRQHFFWSRLRQQ